MLVYKYSPHSNMVYILISLNEKLSNFRQTRRRYIFFIIILKSIGSYSTVLRVKRKSDAIEYAMKKVRMG